MPTRAAIAFIPRSGMLAVTTGPVAVSAKRAVLMSAAPKSRPISEGLIGAASTRIRTSLAAGTGTGISTSDSSSSPLGRTSERSCRAVVFPSVGILVSMGWLLVD